MIIKPFIRWAGGKQTLVTDIIRLFPNKSEINNYYEPFLGAGSLFFASTLNNSFLSDINPQLVNSYNQIKENYKKVSNLLLKYNKLYKFSPNYYYDLRSLYNRDIEKFTHIQAARFIFLIHSNYNGMYRVNKRGYYNVPIGKKRPNIPNEAHLEQISRKLKNSTIYCQDFTTVLNNATYKDFVYLDPPYPPLGWENPQNQYTIDHFTMDQHKLVVSVANELSNRGCFVLLSYPNLPWILEFYKDWTITRLNAFRSISCKKERKTISEILIRNY